MHLLYANDHRADTYLLKALREAGHVVEAADDLADGLEMATTAEHQAIILDWAAPTANCVARFAAASGSALLFVIVGSGGEAERAALLASGADACFMRPVSFMELEARLEALARLVQRVQPAVKAFAVEMAPAEQAVRLNGHTIPLSSREYHLMEHLLAHAGEVIDLERLRQHLWGDESEPKPDLIRTQVSRLRRKLDAAGGGAMLRNVAGHGYVLEPRLLKQIALPTGG